MAIQVAISTCAEFFNFRVAGTEAVIHPGKHVMPGQFSDDMVVVMMMMLMMMMMMILLMIMMMVTLRDCPWCRMCKPH